MTTADGEETIPEVPLEFLSITLTGGKVEAGRCEQDVAQIVIVSPRMPISNPLMHGTRPRRRPSDGVAAACSTFDLERAWGLYVDAGVACARLQGRDRLGGIFQDSVIDANGNLAAAVAAELDALAAVSGAGTPLYLTGKLAPMVRSAVGRGTIFSSAAAAWLSARLLVQRAGDAAPAGLALIELSASGYLVLGVDRSGSLQNDLLVVNPRCGAGSGVNLDRVLQKLGLGRDDVDRILGPYLGTAGAERRRQVTVRADRCGVFSSSATISDKNQGIPLATALAVTLKSEVLKACRRLPRGFAKVRLNGRIFRWQYARDCAADFLATLGVAEIETDPDNDAIIDALHEFVARVGPTAIGEAGARVRQRRPASEYPALVELHRAYEAEHRYLRLPDSRPSITLAGQPLLIGLDVGSTMAKIAVADAASGELVHLAAYSNSGDTIQTVQRVFAALRDAGGETLAVRGIGVTGSARFQVQQALERVYPTLAGRVSVLVENYAHARGSIDCVREHLARLHASGITGVRDDLCILVDIGGEDTKISTIALAEAELLGNAMNVKCSAGTGSLMDTLASMFGIADAAAACAEAMRAPRAPQINATCAVLLMENARKLQAEGAPRAEIVAAANWAIVENMARSLWPQVDLPGDCVLLLHGQTMLSDALPLAVTHRLQSFTGARAFALVPPNPGHRACFGLIRSQLAALDGHVTIEPQRLLDARFERQIIQCHGAACGDRAAVCNRAALTCRDVEGHKLASFTLGGCGAINELAARKRGGGTSVPVRDTYKEIWDFIASRQPRSDDPRRLVIPRSFCVSEWAFLLADMLVRLDVPVHVDEVQEADLLQAQPLLAIDVCAPQIGVIGQYVRLAAAPHGMILAPQIEFLPTGRASLGRTCTVNQGGVAIAADAARRAHPGVRLHLFHFDLSVLTADALAVQLEERLQRVFAHYGIAPSPRELHAALAAAIDAHTSLRRQAADFAAELIEEALARGVRLALVVGREYVLNPGIYDSHVRRLLRDKQMAAIPSYVLEVVLDPAHSHLYWRNPHAIVTMLDAISRRRLHERLRHPRLAALFRRLECGHEVLPVIQVSTFGCGPDSVTAPLVAQIMKRRPFLLIHSDAVLKELAHLENRINTYVKQLELGLHAKFGTAAEPFEIRLLADLAADSPPDPRTDVIYWPTIADNRGLTATLRGAGFTCIDNYGADYDLHALVKQGRQATGDAVCAPLAAVYGDLLRAVADFERRHAASDPQVAGRRRLLYFDSQGTGPCRQGQYVEMHRLLAYRDRVGPAVADGGGCDALGTASLRFLVAGETEGYSFGVEEWVMARGYLAGVMQAVLQQLHFRGAECRDRAEYERFILEYDALSTAVYRHFETYRGPGPLARRLLRLAVGKGALEVALKFVAYGLHDRTLRRLLADFARRWPPASRHAARIRIAVSGEAYMRVAQAEEIFRALLDILGWRRFTLTVSPLWSYTEYLLDDAIDMSREASRRAASGKRQALAGDWDNVLRGQRAVRIRAEGWRFMLRRLIAAPLYAAARQPLPPSTKMLMACSRTLLPTLRPAGELVTYLGEVATELRHGAQVVLNVAPQGCMVSSMGELFTPAIEAAAGRGRVQHLFSADGDLDQELLALAMLKALGPERYLQRAAA